MKCGERNCKDIRKIEIKDLMGIYVRQLNNLDMDYLIKTCKHLDVYNDFLEMKKRVERYLKEERNEA